MLKIIISSLLFTAVVSCNSGLKRIQTNSFTKLLSKNKDDTPADPVQIDLYYESMCPGCKYFFETQLYPTFYKFKGTGVMSVGLYPYGNAREKHSPDGSWKYTCQHGRPECLGNLIEACIMDSTNNDADRFLPVINCIESSEDPARASRGCMTALAGFTKDQIKDVFKCARGSKGNALMHKIALATEALTPPHVYVPWIVMNGVHNKTVETRAMADLTALICDTYQGEKPRLCAA